MIAVERARSYEDRAIDLLRVVADDRDMTPDDDHDLHRCLGRGDRARGAASRPRQHLLGDRREPPPLVGALVKLAVPRNTVYELLNNARKRAREHDALAETVINDIEAHVASAISNLDLSPMAMARVRHLHELHFLHDVELVRAVVYALELLFGHREFAVPVVTSNASTGYSWKWAQTATESTNAPFWLTTSNASNGATR